MTWYHKSADAGCTEAMKNIGNLYEYGQGVSQDHQQAMIWYRKAADAGDEDAKKRLAELDAK
jgi:uncharacterized protein